jgi:molybdopterin converting factor small subunit
MSIALHAAVIVGAKIAHGDFTLDADGVTTINDLFKLADKQQLMGKRFFKKLLARHKRMTLTVLHNGQRLNLPKDLKNSIADGDELDVITPLAGG